MANTNASLATTVAIVTGVSPGGIGLEIALGLCRRGATVVIGSRDPRRATAALDIIRGDGRVVAAGGRVEWISLDLAQLRDVGRWVLLPSPPPPHSVCWQRTTVADSVAGRPPVSFILSTV